MFNVLSQMVVGGIEPLPEEVRTLLRPSIAELGLRSPFLDDLVRLIDAGAGFEDLRARALQASASGELVRDAAGLRTEYADLIGLCDAWDSGESTVDLARPDDAENSLVRLHDTVLAEFLVNQRRDFVRATNRVLKAAALVVLSSKMSEADSRGDFQQRFWKSGGVRIDVRLPAAKSPTWLGEGLPARSPGSGSGDDKAGTPPAPDLAQDQQRLRTLQSAAREVATGPAATLSPATRTLLTELGVGRGRFDAIAAITLLDREIGVIRDRHLADHVGAWTGTIMIGTLLIDIDDRVFSNPGCDPKDLPCYCDLLEDLTFRHWASSQVHVLGMGQAFRVRQTFKQYLQGELVHTEPVLAGSTKIASFQELNETEETSDTFTSEEREEERSARSQSEFELSSEIEREAKKERETEIGASLTASYGTVAISAMAGSTTSTATTEAVKEARKNAQQVVQNAVSRIRNKSEQRRTLRTLSRTQRNNSFEVTNGGGSLTGFYFSINKEYEHQLILVDRRLMFRITVQRPLAFLLHCLATRSEAGVSITKPVDPEVYPMPLEGPLKSASQITPQNALAWAAIYGAEVEPAPQPITVSHAMAVDYKPDKSRWAGAETIEIPKGYKADSAALNVLMTDVIVRTGPFWSNSVPAQMEVHLGDNLLAFSQSTTTATQCALNGEEAGVRLTYHAFCWEHALNVLVHCTASPTAYASWQVKAFTAIRDAYERRKAAYDNQVQAALINQGVKLRGRNPLKNRQLIEEELQKFVLGAVYPPFYYRGFDSLKFGKPCHEKDGGPAMPEVDFIDAHRETPWVTFFLQMLELKNMTYKFLPYVFGNRPDWMTLRRLEDPDPLFETAMTAGQVVIDVPVSPGMTAAFLHFINTGEIWEGGDMPLIGDPMFQDVAHMIQATEDLDDGEPVEAPWQVIAPTTLVYVSDTPPPLL